MRAILPIAAVVLACAGLSGCSIWETDDWNRGGFDDDPVNVFGLRPVYARDGAYDIFSDVVRQPVNVISVVEEGDRLYTVDADLGVHVVDNSDPRSPIQIAFIQVGGIRTATVSGQFLYVNNYGDFVTLDISDLTDIEVVDRRVGEFGNLPTSPPNHRGFFECYDESRGPLLGWEEATLPSPQCRSGF